MGCAMSRMDPSDVLLQCKGRKKAMKEAVSCRQDFAIAHFAYIETLRNVGLALRRFSEGEVTETSPQSSSSPVLRLPEASRTSASDAVLSPPRAESSSSMPSSSSPPPPPSSPPPPPPVAGSSLPAQTASRGSTPVNASSRPMPPSPTTLPSAASPPASSRASFFSQSSPPPRTQASSPRPSISDMPPSANAILSPDREDGFSPPFYSPQRHDADEYYMDFSPSQYSTRSPPPMPSSQQASSWFMFDIFDAPPIPYNLLEQRRRKHSSAAEDDDDDEEEMPPSPAADHERAQKDEGIPDLEDVESKEDEEARSVKSVGKAKEAEEKPPTTIQDRITDSVEEKKKPVSTPEEKVSEVPVEASDGDGKMSEPIVSTPSPEKVAVVKVEPKASPTKELVIITTGQGKDLTGAVRHIHTQFARACRSGKDVSSMLETQTVYRHLGVVDMKDNARVFNAITMHWSRKTSLAMRDVYDDDDMPECGMFGSHASTLERLHAWEKKLYDEVKAGEIVRTAFERKCKQLNNLDAREGDGAAREKMRAALKKLDTRLIVALRAIHLASTRIQKLTDEELYPQLAELLGGLMTMWKVMLECHKAQAAVASEMQTIENSVAANEASEVHIKATSKLEGELRNWQIQFERWINSQRNYIQALHAWLSSCYLEPERNDISSAVSPCRLEKPPVFSLLSNWKDALLKFEEPQRALKAISDFSVEVHSLEIEQAGELDLKKNVERSTRDLDYRTRSLKRYENKYLEYKEAANGDIANGLSKTRADMDTQQSLVESSRQRHTVVMLDRKEKTLSRFREHLPTVFEAMASFAREAMKTYEKLHPGKALANGNGTSHFHTSEA